MNIEGVVEDLTVLCRLLDVVEAALPIEEQLQQLCLAACGDAAQDLPGELERIALFAGHVARMIMLSQGFADDIAHTMSQEFALMITGHAKHAATG